MTNKQLMLSQLLDCWTLITGVPTRMIPSVERALFEFSKHYTKADLEMTLNYIVRENRRAERPWKLRFEKFFDDEFKHFESLRGEAEQYAKARAAKSRAWKPEPGQAAWAAAHGEEPIPPATEPRLPKNLILSNLDKIRTDISKQ